MPKQFFKDQMSINESMVMQLLASEIARCEMHRLPLKTIFLQPQYFQIFEDLNKKCYTDEEIADAGGEYMIAKVHIEKGTRFQKYPAAVDYWPQTIKDRERNREAIGRKSLYEA